MRDLLNLIMWMLLGLFRSKTSLEAEILAPRHQLNVLPTPRRRQPGSTLKAGPCLVSFWSGIFLRCSTPRKF
jgi:hypothetical protein